jgi:branched-chain amino acid transport system permease protein
VIEFSVAWAGVLSGAIYALLGLSYLLIFRATTVLSFAVGGSAGLAGVAIASWRDWPQAQSVVFAVVLGAAAAVFIDVFIARPVQAREIGHFGTVLALAASLFVLIQLTGLLFGRQTLLGDPVRDGTIDVAGQTLTTHSLVVVVFAVAVTALLATWMRRGARGRLLRALGDNAEAAHVLCLPVGGVRILAVGLAGALAAAAGILHAGRAPMTFQSGFEMSLVGFLAVVIGGLASAWGPLFGGLLLGLVESVGSRLWGAQWRDYLLVVVVLVAFRLRPQGIFSTAVRDWD